MNKYHRPVIILAGGLGTRLRTVTGETPKVLAPIGNRPFLGILLDELAEQGFQHFVLSCGYRAESIRQYIDEGHPKRADVRIELVVEQEALGTGGAIHHVLRTQSIRTPFFVVNGDTFVPGGLSQLAMNDDPYPCKMALVSVPDASRYGAVEQNELGEIIKFQEKSTQASSGLINSGLYALSPELFTNPGSYSIEREVFPAVCAARQAFGVVIQSSFIDIGVPEDYHRFVSNTL